MPGFLHSSCEGPAQACVAGSAFSQLRTAAAIEALHAAKFSKFDPLILAGKPPLAEGLQAAMRLLPKLGQRLTACAVWAKACFTELDEGTQKVAVALAPAVCQIPHKSPHPYCITSVVQGVFQMAHKLMLLGITVGGHGICYGRPAMMWEDNACSVCE